MTETTTTARTVTPRAWAAATQDSPLLPGSMNEAVRSCMAELQQEDQDSIPKCAPWPIGPRACEGAMWPGVPAYSESFQDSEGAWFFSCRATRPEGDSHYVRLMPALSGAEVQYGFCPIRADRFPDLMRSQFGKSTPVLRRVCIHPSRSSDFPVIESVTVLAELCDLGNPSEPAQRFQHLMSGMPLHVLIKDITRGVHSDGTRSNVLVDRDSTYRELVGLMVNHMYPQMMTPRTSSDLDRFIRVMGLGNSTFWRVDLIRPMMYNVVMPQCIFDLVHQALQEGKPPIIPMYVMSGHWMFNGRWSDPCVGVSFPSTPRVCVEGGKMVAGVVNRFNSDLPGGVSYWPFTRNPPDEWLNRFCECFREYLEEDMPLAVRERTDLALLHGRNIPVLFNCATPAEFKYGRLASYEITPDRSRMTLTNLATRECDAKGEWTDGTPPVTEVVTSPSTGDSEESDEETYHCASCNEYCSNPLQVCPRCEEPTCNNCLRGCGECDFRGCSVCDDHRECEGDI